MVRWTPIEGSETDGVESIFRFVVSRGGAVAATEKGRTTTGTGPVASAPVPEPLLHGFQELGLSPYEARVLVALLRQGSANSVELARLSGVPRTAVYPVLQGLGERGLAERVSGPGPAVWASRGRDQVISRLKAAAEDRLRLHRQRADDLRDLLERSFPEAPPEVPLPFVHVLTGASQLKGTHEQMLGAVQTEVMMFTRPTSTWAFVNPSQDILDMLAGGVQMRVLYEAQQWDSPGSEAFRTEMTVYHDAGMQARLVDELPVQLVVVDRSVALVHMPHPDSVDGYPSTIHVRHRGFAEMAALAFEQFWAGARPLRPGRSPRTHNDARSLRGSLRSTG